MAGAAGEPEWGEAGPPDLTMEKKLRKLLSDLKAEWQRKRVRHMAPLFLQLQFNIYKFLGGSFFVHPARNFFSLG